MRAIIAALFAAVLLAGCATLTNVDHTRLGVMYATAKVIDGDQGKAGKILAIAADVRERLQDEALTVAALDAAVRAQVPWASLDIADQLLADALLVELRAELEKRVGTNPFGMEQRLSVLAVLSWVEAAAHMSQ